MARRMLVLALPAILTSCGGPEKIAATGPSATAPSVSPAAQRPRGSRTAGKVIRRLVVRNGKQMTEERISREARLPFKYEAWVTQFKAGIDSRLLSIGTKGGVEAKVLREVSERIQLLVHLRTELAKDWNAFAITEADYARRSEEVDRSMLALQTLAGAEGNADLSQAVLDQIAEWTRRPPPAPVEAHRPLKMRVWTVGQRRGRAGGYEEVLIREGAIMYSGDKFRVGVQPSKECYVYLIIYDGQQKANVYFPSAHTSMDNHLGADQELYIPGGRKWFALDDQTGIETIYVFASEDRMSDVDLLAREMEKAGREFGRGQEMIAVAAARTRGGKASVGMRGVLIVEDGSDAVQKVSQLQDGREIRKVTALVEGYGEAVRCITIDHR